MKLRSLLADTNRGIAHRIMLFYIVLLRSSSLKHRNSYKTLSLPLSDVALSLLVYFSPLEPFRSAWGLCYNGNGPDTQEIRVDNVVIEVIQ